MLVVHRKENLSIYINTTEKKITMQSLHNLHTIHTIKKKKGKYGGFMKDFFNPLVKCTKLLN